MESIDYLNFNNLTCKQSKEFDDLVNSVEFNYNNIIENIYHFNKGNHNWYFSSVASRNLFQSCLFERLCKLTYTNQYCQKYSHRIINVFLNDDALYKILGKNIPNNCKLNFTGTKKSIFSIIFLSFRNILKYYSVLVTLFVFSIIYSRKKKIINPLMLIDTFVLSGKSTSGTINNGIYNDRYYPDFIQNIGLKGKTSIFYIPTILFDRKFINTYYKIYKHGGFVLKESYISFEDWLTVFKLPFKKVKLPNNLNFLNVNITNLISEELRLNNFNISKLIAEINYLFIKNLNKNHVKISYFIDWYENQVIDRGMYLGLRKYYPNVQICGYQGFFSCYKFSMHLAPTKTERDHLLTPHILAVTGTCLLNRPKKHYNIKTIVAPAFRFQHLHKPREFFPRGNKKSILIPFSICQKTSLTNLKFVTDVISKCFNKDDFIIHVKLHPASCGDNVLKSVKEINSDVAITTNDIEIGLQESHIVVGSASSVFVEGLVYNLTIIIIGNCSGITANPIPDKYMDQCKIVYDADELAKNISEASNCKPVIRFAKEIILEDCFKEVNQDSVKAFLSELKN